MNPTVPHNPANSHHNRIKVQQEPQTDFKSNPSKTNSPSTTSSINVILTRDGRTYPRQRERQPDCRHSSGGGSHHNMDRDLRFHLNAATTRPPVADCHHFAGAKVVGGGRGRRIGANTATQPGTFRHRGLDGGQHKTDQTFRRRTGCLITSVIVLPTPHIVLGCCRVPATLNSAPRQSQRSRHCCQR